MRSGEMEVPRLAPEGTPKMAAPVEIKRSSWNAGMAINSAEPPPGSPAAWRRSDSMSGTRPNLSRASSPLGRARSPGLLSAPFPGPSLGPTLGPPLGGALNVPLNGSLGMPPPRSASPIRGSSPVRNPFNFDSRSYIPAAGSQVSNAMGPSQRRGHRYKHSSVSINFFQEPEVRAPLAVPVSLAVPTLSECLHSISVSQARALAWGALHVAVAVFVLMFASRDNSGVPESMATLAHLLAYDAVDSLCIAGAQILSNFDAWKTSSLRFPFALQRVEVLLSFGLAITMVFVGADIISHTIQHTVSGLFYNAHHHHHHHETKLGVHLALVLLSLIVTAPGVIQAPERMGIATLTFALCVLVLPAFPAVSVLDSLLTAAMGAAMVWLGWGAAKLSGGMLVMSYGGPDRSQTIRDIISRDPAVTDVPEVSLWQVHHDLWLANLRVVVQGALEDEKRVRNEAVLSIKTTMGADVGSDVVWDISVDISRSE